MKLSIFTILAILFTSFLAITYAEQPNMQHLRGYLYQTIDLYNAKVYYLHVPLNGDLPAGHNYQIVKAPYLSKTDLSIFNKQYVEIDGIIGERGFRKYVFTYGIREVKR